MNKYLLSSAAALSLVLCASGGALAASPSAPQDKMVVRDSAGNVVKAYVARTCVRSNGLAAQDDCAEPVAAPAPAPVPAPQQMVTKTVLSNDERVVYFNFNKSTLTPEARQNLDKVVARLKAAKDVKSASIVGYADRIGSASYNEALSARRAETVRDYLVQHGYLDVNVAEVRALGKSRPVTDCPKSLPRSKAIACLSPDRRVEVELVYADRVTRPATAPMTAVPADRW